MQINCPTCKSQIPTRHIYVQTQLVYCSSCDNSYPVPLVLLSRTASTRLLADELPRGMSFTENDSGWTLEVSLRSCVGLVVGLIACILSAIPIVALGTSQIANGQLDLRMLVALCVPFLLLLFFAWRTLSCACGRMTVSVERKTDVGKVFTGVPMLGRTQRFNWSAVRQVDEALVVMDRGKICPAIAIVCDRPIVFGELLTDAELLHAMEYLRRKLAARDSAIRPPPHLE